MVFFLSWLSLLDWCYCILKPGVLRRYALISLELLNGTFSYSNLNLNPAVYSLSLNDLVSDYNLCFSCFSNTIIFSKLKLLFSSIIYCLLWNRNIEINDIDLIKWCVVDNSTHMFNVFLGFFSSISFIFLCCNLKLLWFIFWAIGNNGSFTKLIPKQ